MRTITGMGLLLYAAASGAPIVDAEQSCAQGDHNSCQVADLAQRIEADRLFGSEGKYQLVLEDRWLLQSHSYFDIFGRAQEQAKATCAVATRVWVSADVAEFARLQSMTVVDRAQHASCLTNATNNFRREYTEDMVLGALKYVAAPVLALGAVIALFWYRRPLGRRLRKAKDKVNSLGAE